jgi:hypothetical protein
MWRQAGSRVKITILSSVIYMSVHLCLCHLITMSELRKLRRKNDSSNGEKVGIRKQMSVAYSSVLSQPPLERLSKTMKTLLVCYLLYFHIVDDGILIYYYIIINGCVDINLWPVTVAARSKA